jgi:isoaspartyl peptidase/L-asparaginase-like protein (Ntn-hydrolase superfamily)
MISRRKFIAASSAVALGAVVKPVFGNVKGSPSSKSKKGMIPVVISTWNFGIQANEAAWEVLNSGGSSLDAVEAGARVPEGDPNEMTVGFGGHPDRDGNVTLDACIMDKEGNAGSVSFLKHIKHPISVARMVMEKTPHVMLSGDGALQFAMENGFKKEDILTEKAKEAWEKWKLTSKYEPKINIENHDTIGMLAIDKNGDLAGACTTSGAAYKMHGRVGDSPIIGAGLYADNEVGGAVATGMGELVMKTLGTFLVVELMRNGLSPQKACEEAVKRIAGKLKDYKNFQVGFLAINKAGEVGSYCIHPGFNYALYQNDKNTLIDSDSYLKS